MYKCELKDQQKITILSIRIKTSIQRLQEELHRALNSIQQYLKELKEIPAGPPCAIYYNSDMENLDVEIGYPVSKKIDDRLNIKLSEIPAAKTATCIHVGPHNEIEFAYRTLTRWIEDRGFEPTGVVYEFFLNDPQNTPAQELETLVVFPIS